MHNRGANLEDPDKEGQTPLMIACKVGREKCAEFIIEKLAEKTTDEFSIKKFGRGGVDKPGKDTWCPLHIAVAHENYSVVKTLLGYGAKPDKPLSTRYDKITPLMLAAANGDLEMVRILIAKKAKIEKPDRYKRTALTHAVINGAANVASYLLSLGADPNKLDSSQNSNLHYASAYGWWFCMIVLIEAGAVVDAKNEWSLTPLGVAILKGNKGIVDHLVHLPGIDIDMKDDKGRTILLNMMVDQTDYTDGLFEDMKKIVEKCGADPKLKDYEGKSALHFLANSRITKANDDEKKIQIKFIKDITTYFIKKGLSTFDEDESGNFPLVYAFRNQHNCDGYSQYQTGNIELINLLLGDMIKNLKEISAKKASPLLRKIMIDLLEFSNNLS